MHDDVGVGDRPPAVVRQRSLNPKRVLRRDHNLLRIPQFGRLDHQGRGDGLRRAHAQQMSAIRIHAPCAFLGVWGFGVGDLPDSARPAPNRYHVSATNSTAPNAIFTTYGTTGS